MNRFNKSNRRNNSLRKLQMESLEVRQTMNADFDDQMSEARPIGVSSSVPSMVSGVVDNRLDVDMYRFSASAGQTIDFDIDTQQNGPGGLGSYIRIFDSSGRQLAANNDAAAPGESRVGFDSYLRYQFATSGTYYIGVSNWTNTNYNAGTGTGDSSGTSHATGNYQLITRAMPNDTDDSISEAFNIGSVSNVPRVLNREIDWDVDVDMVAFRVTAGQSVDIDIDTPRNGPGGLGSYIRLFDSAGRQLAANNDGAAPGEPLGFDSFLRHRFTQGGTFYVGVSNWLNTSYSATTGNNDSPSWQHAVGNYSLVINTTPTGRWMAAPDVAVASLPTVNEIAKTPTTAGTLDVRTEEVSFQARTSPAVPALAMEVIKETKSISSRTAANERLDDWFADFSKNFDDLSTFARV
jgi:hypothetical protein